METGSDPGRFQRVKEGVSRLREEASDLAARLIREGKAAGEGIELSALARLRRLRLGTWRLLVAIALALGGVLAALAGGALLLLALRSWLMPLLGHAGATAVTGAVAFLGGLVLLLTARWLLAGRETDGERRG